MIVFYRKALQKIKIGDEMTITVLSIRKNRIRLVLEAPEHLLEEVSNGEPKVWKAKKKGALFGRNRRKKKLIL